MKNKIVLIILFIFPINIKSSIGCMDNSFHMECCYTKKSCRCINCCDTKNWHYVQCSCPCKWIIDYRGKCRKCQHFGNPDRGIINMRLQNKDFFQQ